MAEWISVNDGMPPPEDFSDVLVTVQTDGGLKWVEIGVWHFGTWIGPNFAESSQRAPHIERDGATVTHWMPMPEPADV